MSTATLSDSSWFAASNAERPFIAPREMVYYASLDPSHSYSLPLGPDADGAKGVALHSVTFYSGS
jgi:hypothetical protein